MDRTPLALRSPPPAADNASLLLLSAAVAEQRFEVVELIGDDALARRLGAAGLWPGAAIERIARAPFGDPLLFRLHGYRLALRRSEADRVVVRVATVGGETGP